MSESHGTYYVPPKSRWPFLCALGLFFLAFGSVNMLHSHYLGPVCLGIGFVVTVATIAGWFTDVVKESQSGLYDDQMDRSFRWGMVWFIFSEIMFFAAFFGALFYVRMFSVPWLAGNTGVHEFQLTHLLMWPNFKEMWPLFHNPNPAEFPGPKATIPTWGIPALNTLILLSSAVTLTWSHWALKMGNRKHLMIGLALTILLGLIFVGFQCYEYFLAHTKYGFTISSGIYGSTFYMLTSFHALHVIIGLIILIVLFMRCLKGHFTAENHFGFEAGAWYWHFVDVVWLILFVFVYWL